MTCVATLDVHPRSSLRECVALQALFNLGFMHEYGAGLPQVRCNNINREKHCLVERWTRPTCCRSFSAWLMKSLPRLRYCDLPAWAACRTGRLLIEP